MDIYSSEFYRVVSSKSSCKSHKVLSKTDSQIAAEIPEANARVLKTEAAVSSSIQPLSSGLGCHSIAEVKGQLRRNALQAARRGEFSTAIAIFNHLLICDPSNAADYNNRGLIHFQAGNLEAAIADYDQAIALDSELDSAYNNRANYYAAAGNYMAAILDYESALDLNTLNIRAWINQGITFRDLGMYERALENFDIALGLGDLEGHIYAERGRTHHLSGDWNWAMTDYYQALALLSEQTSNFTTPANRLRSQVQHWIDELLAAT